MKKILSIALTTLFVSTSALAENAPAATAKPAAAKAESAPVPGSCEAKALSKDGKPLHGAAKNASVKKCMADNPAPAATDGKSVQQNKMTKCNADAAGKKGDERKQFMSACLSN